jgi:hypothetical protein
MVAIAPAFAGVVNEWVRCVGRHPLGLPAHACQLRPLTNTPVEG